MGVLLYFGKSTFLIFMSCFHTIRFSYEGCNIYVHYYSSLFIGRIHTNIHHFIHVIQSLFFSLFFLCMLVRILSSKIYFLCFFLESLHIELIYYFYKYLVRDPSQKSRRLVLSSKVVFMLPGSDSSATFGINSGANNIALLPGTRLKIIPGKNDKVSKDKRFMWENIDSYM